MSRNSLVKEMVIGTVERGKMEARAIHVNRIGLVERKKAPRMISSCSSKEVMNG